MIVRVEDLQKSFGGRPILDRATCTFPPHKISTVLGTSGSGKTTLLRILAGLESPDSGDVYFGDTQATALPPQLRRVGFVFQELALYSHLSVEENLQVTLKPLRISASAATKRILEITRHFGLESTLDRLASTLSGGEQQRLALCRTLIREPRVVLLDEPFRNLDAHIRREARRFVFSELRRYGTTAILVTHDHQDAQEAEGTVFVLSNGRFIQEGSWDYLYNSPAQPNVANLVSFLEPVVIAGSTRSSGGKLLFESRTLGLSLPVAPQLAAARPQQETSAELWFRPEELIVRPSPPTHSGGSLIKAEVRTTFLQGAGRFCHLRHHSGWEFAASYPGDTPLTPNTLGFVDFNSAHQLLLWST